MDIKTQIAALLLAFVACVGCEELPRARHWSDCKYSSNWNNNAAQRMMNIASPSFSAAKVREYLDWQEARGCDHIHILLVNDADGEGAGYDALADADTRRLALRRVRMARMRGLGIAAWIVADDSDAARRRIFANPEQYAAALRDYMPYLSYICLGLEMDEGVGSMADWTRVRDAVRVAGWHGPIATHHVARQYTYATLGDIVMDQLDPGCSAAQVMASVRALVAHGYYVCGFEYSRAPNRDKAQAALSAGAFSCGNW